MEQYKTLEEALAEMAESEERPVVVEQFTNPKPADERRGISRIFISQLVLCVMLAAVFAAGKYAFPDIFNPLYELIIESMSNVGVPW